MFALFMQGASQVEATPWKQISGAAIIGLAVVGCYKVGQEFKIATETEDKAIFKPFNTNKHTVSTTTLMAALFSLPMVAAGALALCAKMIKSENEDVQIMYPAIKGIFDFTSFVTISFLAGFLLKKPTFNEMKRKAEKVNRAINKEIKRLNRNIIMYLPKLKSDDGTPDIL